jgi:hypothetical protein
MKLRDLPVPALIALVLVGACKSEGGDESSTAATMDLTGSSTGPGTTGPATDGTSTAPTTGSESTAPTTGTPDGTTMPGDDTTGTPVTGCTAYCDTIETNCAGDFSQYGTREMCEATCATFAPGTDGDMMGNSLACRTYHAGAAAMANDVHCGHAGPGGDMACGSNCEGFCGIAAAVCPEAWPDIAACAMACGTFDPGEKYDATDVKGNTFACRLYHLTAATVDPVVHCGHIKGDSPTCM